MKVKLTAVLLVAGSLLTGGCGGSNGGGTTPEETAAAAAPNLFDNGYRLVRHISEFSYTTKLSVSEYNYMFESGQINRKRYKQEPGSDVEEDESISVLYIDAAGRLSGGSYDYTFGTTVSGTTNYELDYNEQGQLTRFSESPLDRFSFIYDNGQLDKIEHRLTSDLYVYDYTYDSSDRLQSVTSGVTGEIKTFLYDQNNVNSGISSVDQFGNQKFTYNFEYDSFGNLVTIETISPLGALFSTERFEYESSSEKIFNHWKMKLIVEPFDMVTINFVR